MDKLGGGGSAVTPGDNCTHIQQDGGGVQPAEIASKNCTMFHISP